MCFKILFLKKFFLKLETKISGLKIDILVEIASGAKSSKITEKWIPNFAHDNMETDESIDADACIITLHDDNFLFFSLEISTFENELTFLFISPYV